MGAELTTSVAVVGAGWAGLTAAVRLQQRGIGVEVFESARHPGGRARGVDWAGQRIDNGQHLLVGAYSACLDVIRAVGGDPARLFLRRPLTVLVPGRFQLALPKLPAPLHLALGLVRATGADWRDKWAAIRFMRALQAANYRLPQDTTVASWLDEHHQTGSLREHLWNALCLAALNTAPNEASAQVFANVLRDTLGGPRAATDLLLPKVDLGAVFPELACQNLGQGGAKLHFSARVDAIAPEGAGWTLRMGDDVRRFSQIVIATAPWHASRLLPPLAQLHSLQARLAALESEPIATAYLQYPPDKRLPQALIALNRDHCQWLADRGQLGGPAGQLAHVLSARGEWEDLGTDALVASLHATTAHTLGGHWPSAPSAYRVIKEKRATFRCSPGLDRPPSRAPLPGLWLAGDYVASDYPGTLESAVRSGDAAAAGIAESLTT